MIKHSFGSQRLLACLAQVLAAYNIPSVLSPLSLWSSTPLALSGCDCPMMCVVCCVLWLCEVEVASFQRCDDKGSVSWGFKFALGEHPEFKGI